MARSAKSKGNKFSSIASNTPRNLPFRETLTIEERVRYDELNPEQQSGYEQFCSDHVRNNTVDDYLKYSQTKSTPNTVTAIPTPKAEEVVPKETNIEKTKTEETVIVKETVKPIEQPVEKVTSETNIATDINDFNPVQSVQNIINQNLSVEEEAGKNISVYLSAEALNVVTKYMKKHKVKNRSKLIETVLLNVLKE